MDLTKITLLFLRFVIFKLFLTIGFVICDNNQQCQNITQCELLENTSCLAVTLPYRATKVGYFVGGNSYDNEYKVKQYLAKWRVLQSVPRCWTSLQSFLCTLYLPKCDNDRVHLPSYDMCNSARHNCKFIEMYFGHDNVPPFLNCSQNYMKSNCSNGYQDLKFNSFSAKCKYPLTPTDDSNIWYPGIDGCGLQCDLSLISTEEQTNLQNIIWYGGLSSSLVLFICFFTFRVDWKSADRYPSVAVYYLIICLIFHNLGWMIQFFISKQSIVCRLDNTRRYSESSSPGSASCLIVFFLIYYFSIAAAIWVAVLSFLWFHKLKVSNGNFNDLIERKRQPFHVAAWSVPFVLCVIIICINKVDSSPMLGICYVGFDNPIMRITFVLIPIISSILISVFYLIKTMLALIKAKSIAVSHLDKRRKRDTINRLLSRLGIFSIWLILALIGTTYAHILEYLSSDKWKQTLDSRVLCALDLIPVFAPSRANECETNVSSPSLLHVKIHLIMVLSSGFSIVIWLLTRASWEAWRRFFLKKCDAYIIGRSGRKHKMLAKAYTCGNAAIYNQESLHGDPVDMNLTSATSQEISTEWVNNLPKFIQRRAAIVKLNNANHYLPRYRNYTNNNNSSASEISMQQGMSIGSMVSNQQSLDSQVSNDGTIYDAPRHQVRRKTKSERVRLSSRLNHALWRRRGSDSSIQSNNLAVVGNLVRQHEGVTRATSTGDLQLPGPSILPTVCNYLPPTFPLPAPSFPHPSGYPVISPTVSVISRPRTEKPSSNHPFTHGMSQQGDSLINPLQERRRPDSRTNGHSVSPPNDRSASQQNQNLGVGYLNSFNCAVPMSGQPLGSFANPNLLVNGCGPPNGLPNYYGFQARTPFAQHQQPAPSIYNYYPSMVPCAPPFTNGVSNLGDLARAREALLPLVTGVDTGSENGDSLFRPIIISDSEGFTDGGFGPSVSRPASRSAHRFAK
ncbi:smoothened homolog [Panonychus citri]|uniref:smoothened homolog n=1 Tax=Panonychus citri TaxID=50023 RepID=UPI0023070EB6|nr:smoothened homolog [Panonychus citri]